MNQKERREKLSNAFRALEDYIHNTAPNSERPALSSALCSIYVMAVAYLASPQPEESDRESDHDLLSALDIADHLEYENKDGRASLAMRYLAAAYRTERARRLGEKSIRADERRKADKYEKALDDIANTPTSDIGDSIDYATWARDTAKAAILGKS